MQETNMVEASHPYGTCVLLELNMTHSELSTVFPDYYKELLKSDVTTQINFTRITVLAVTFIYQSVRTRNVLMTITVSYFFETASVSMYIYHTCYF